MTRLSDEQLKAMAAHDRHAAAIREDRDSNVKDIASLAGQAIKDRHMLLAEVDMQKAEIARLSASISNYRATKLNLRTGLRLAKEWAAARWYSDEFKYHEHANPKLTQAGMDEIEADAFEAFRAWTVKNEC